MGLGGWLRWALGGTTPVPTNPRLAAAPEEAKWLVYMEQPVYADALNARRPGSATHTATREAALAAVGAGGYDAVLALSPMAAAGTAAAAIREFRAASPGGLTVYHGWDYRVEVSGPQGLACGADLLLLGGLLDHEVMVLLTAGVLLKAQGHWPSAPDLRRYEGMLREACPSSPVWQVAEQFRRGGMPPSEYE
jgi:hypothetical protein